MRANKRLGVSGGGSWLFAATHDPAYSSRPYVTLLVAGNSDPRPPRHRIVCTRADHDPESFLHAEGRWRLASVETRAEARERAASGRVPAAAHLGGQVAGIRFAAQRVRALGGELG